MIIYNTAGQKILVEVSGTTDSVDVYQYSGFAWAGLAGTFDNALYPGATEVTLAVGDTNAGTGHWACVCLDVGGNVVGVHTDYCLFDIPVILTSANVRTSLGMATGNLDTQLAALSALAAPGAIRNAVGLALANLDTQLAAIGTTLTPSQIRAAIGLSSANLDSQLSSIGGGMSAFQIRQALGMVAADLDAQLSAILRTSGEHHHHGHHSHGGHGRLLETLQEQMELIRVLLSRLPVPQGSVTGSRS